MDYAAMSVGNTAEEDAAGSLLLRTVSGLIEKLVARSSERGYVTYDELSAALPLDQLSSEDIEDAMTMLSELGITVTENDENEEPVAPKASRPGQAVTSIMTIPGVPTTRFGCICGRWGRSSACRVKERWRLRSASRPAER
jgi:Sigma-70 factor, region 1.1